MPQYHLIIRALGSSQLGTEKADYLIAISVPRKLQGSLSSLFSHTLPEARIMIEYFKAISYGSRVTDWYNESIYTVTHDLGSPCIRYDHWKPRGHRFQNHKSPALNQRR